jgi:DNA-binding CsgD family transcriptional regulator
LHNEFEFGSLAVFDGLLANLDVAISDVQERSQGAAFLRVAREAYPLKSVVYLGLNIPIGNTSSTCYVHCIYGDASAQHATSKQRVNIERLGLADRFLDRRDESDQACDTRSQDGGLDSELSIALTAYHGESAALIVQADEHMEDWESRRSTIEREFRALGQYFHQHMLRIFGRNDEKAIIVSAREIDCLKWMAAGKTAWEVSAILGISERTVRFHLNAAREKLECTTTTQAVAKAVSQQLFVP